MGTSMGTSEFWRVSAAALNANDSGDIFGEWRGESMCTSSDAECLPSSLLEQSALVTAGLSAFDDAPHLMYSRTY
jgi:hypothetical protein